MSRFYITTLINVSALNLRSPEEDTHSVKAVEVIVYVTHGLMGFQLTELISVKENALARN